MLVTSSFLLRKWAKLRFAEACLKAAKGESGIVQPSFVYLPGVPGGDAVQKEVDGLNFFSTNVELGVCLLSNGKLITSLTVSLGPSHWETSPTMRRNCFRKLSLNCQQTSRRVLILLLLVVQSCNSSHIKTYFEDR